MIPIFYSIEPHKSKQCIIPHPYTSCINYKYAFWFVNALHFLAYDNPFNLPRHMTTL